MKELLKNKKFVIGGISLLFLLVIGFTYAVIVWTTTNYNLSIETSCFDIDYVLGQDITAVLSPINENTYIEDSDITITTDMAISSISLAFDSDCTRYNGIATIELNTTSIDSAFTNEGDSYGSLKYALVPYDSTDYPSINTTILSGETFHIVASGEITSTGVKDIYSLQLTPGDLHEYIIIFYIDSNLIDTDVIGASFTGRVDARAEQTLTVPEGVHVPAPISNFYYVLGNGTSTTEITSFPIYDYASDSATSQSDRVETTYTPGSSLYIDGDEILLTGYKGNDTSITIPDTYTINGNTYRVKILSYIPYGVFNSYGLFQNNSTVEEIYLSNNVDGVEYIAADGEWMEGSLHRAFRTDTSLKKVTIPETITYMDSAFAFCYDLEEVTINSNNVDNVYFMLNNVPNNVIIRTSYNTTTYDSIAGEIANRNIGNENDGGHVIFSIFSNDVVEETPLSDFYYLLGSDNTQIVELPIYHTNLDSSYATSLKTRTYELVNEFSDLIIESDDILLTGYKGNSRIISIPNTYTVGGNTYNVKILSHFTDDNWEIDEYGLLNYNHAVEEIYFGDNVTSVGYYPDEGWQEGYLYAAFRFDVSLKKVSGLPVDTTDLNTAFGFCYSLEEAPTIPSGVTNMNSSFFNCNNLTGTIKINSDNVNDFEQAFEGTTKPITVVVPFKSITESVINESIENSPNITITRYR